MKTFFDRYKEAGSPNLYTAILNLVDDMVDEWHEGDSELPLSAYLGFTHEEYARWVEDPDHVFVLLRQRKMID